MKELLKVTGLNVVFDTPAGRVHANRGINLMVNENETLGLMGESGCGKTVLFLSLLRLQQPGRIVSGSIVFDGRDLTKLTTSEMQQVRGRQIALVPQDHSTALNPAFTVGQQLNEALLVRDNGGGLWKTSLIGCSGRGSQAFQEEVKAVLGELALGDLVDTGRLLGRYPHQLSGGIRQRVLIAMALLGHPRMLIADEPTTALDRASRVQTLEVLNRLCERMTMLIISHDLDAIRTTCERVAVMYGGRIIETGPMLSVFRNPRHPYTRLFLSCQKFSRGDVLPEVTGDVLNLIDFPLGCSFHPRCPRAMPVCSELEPAEVHVDDTMVACHLYATGETTC
ncbi:MAG: ABC transporter ATP-binding protein [Dehalococcoidia bacterium]|nr:ABC transporter ATP-binding protein [Dehalococcoidia bacterium]